MGLRGSNGNGARADHDETPAEVARDAEEAFVAALQESDTAVEALQDAGNDHRSPWQRRRWQLGALGLVTAFLSVMVTRRRR